MWRRSIQSFTSAGREHTEENAITGVGGVETPTMAEVGVERFEPVTALLLVALGWPHGGFDPWGAGQGDSVPPSSQTPVS